MHSSRMRTDRCSGRQKMSVLGGSGQTRPLEADPTPKAGPHHCEQADTSENITFPCDR